MNTNSAFLHVKGDKIVNGSGKVIRLRGFCLGGWMNMENSITGYPGNESGHQKALERVIGKEKTDFFFERFLHYFVLEEDLRFLKGLGVNVARVALNYRHFESDDQPFLYQLKGFAILDQIIRWAHDLQIYIIIDLHAVQGWQNRGWHCDNPNREPHFWGQKNFEDRAVALWEALARHYREEPFVAGYNLMNEPDAMDVIWLNHYYRRATSAIRAVDPDHILFLDGNHYAQDFSQFEPPFDDNSVYSYHFYPEPIMTAKDYPYELNGKVYDRGWLEQVITERSEFMRRYGVPAWAGEFGCLYTDQSDHRYCFDLMHDLIDLMESHGHHWTIWTYKDIGKLGLVYLHPESNWMRWTRTVRDIKTTLRCDFWVERHESEIGQLLNQVVEYVKDIVLDQPGDWSNLSDNIYGAVCEYALSQMLLPTFAEQFRGISKDVIEQVMQSFTFQKCIVREGLVEVISKYLEKEP